MENSDELLVEKLSLPGLPHQAGLRFTGVNDTEIKEFLINQPQGLLEQKNRIRLWCLFKLIQFFLSLANLGHHKDVTENVFNTIYQKQTGR